jgi:hypothetical protein
MKLLFAPSSSSSTKPRRLILFPRRHGRLQGSRATTSRVHVRSVVARSRKRRDRAGAVVATSELIAEDTPPGGSAEGPDGPVALQGARQQAPPRSSLLARASNPPCGARRPLPPKRFLGGPGSALFPLHFASLRSAAAGPSAPGRASARALPLS